MIGFARDRDEITARFTSDEAALLRSLAGQLSELLLDRSAQTRDDAAAVLFAQAGIGGGTSAPLDPSLARLLPDAYVGDVEAASEHRHLTERSLIERKVRNAGRLAADLAGEGGPVAVRLDADAVQAWLRALTDLRLTIAARLEIVEDGDEGRVDDESDAAMLAVYDWLGHLQGGLIACLDRLDDRDGRDRDADG